MKVMERSTTRNASFRSDPLGIVGANTTLTRACSIALGRLAPGGINSDTLKMRSTIIAARTIEM
jgi:hypothetical protein